MKTNLSSQIKLDRVAKRYYDPQGEIELAALTREEKIYTRIFETADDGSAYLADNVAETIRRSVAAKNRCVLALGSGRNTHAVYARLIEMYQRGEVSFDRVTVFNLSEFFPLLPDGPSTLARLKEVFLDKVDVRPENVHSINPAVTMEDMFDYCKEYERKISDCGGIDLTLCEIGPGGSLAFNEPGSLSTSLCRLVLLSAEVRHQIQSTYKCDVCPATAITLGLGNILSSSRILCMAWGENRAKVVQQAIEGPVSDTVPASFLQLHNHTKVAIDLGAADNLTRISHPWMVTSCEWTPKLTRRAIVWLCE
ncbi:MAG: 6-phosphogluconolactonase, partial [Muribaculaceae bacterium]|nr:6-phosphogluconolactonase [Muribaculaceae bacterium]